MISQNHRTTERPTMTTLFAMPEQQPGVVEHVLINTLGLPMSFADAFRYIRKNAVEWHTKVLRAVPMMNTAGVFIEFPQLTRDNMQTPFKMAIIAAEHDFARAGPPTPDVFTTTTTINRVISHNILLTPNLSGDTMLLMPHPNTYHSCDFSNICKYVQNTDAMDTQGINAFWGFFVEIIKDEITKRGYVWVSTHGLGVNWLHVRFAREPKYYICRDYANTG